jgi:hypothetical protein
LTVRSGTALAQQHNADTRETIHREFRTKHRVQSPILARSAQLLVCVQHCAREACCAAAASAAQVPEIIRGRRKASGLPGRSSQPSWPSVRADHPGWRPTLPSLALVCGDVSQRFRSRRSALLPRARRMRPHSKSPNHAAEGCAHCTRGAPI